MVIADHIGRRQEGDLERDLRDNYAETVIVISHEQTGLGHDAIRRTAAVLDSEVDAPSYQIVQLETFGRIAYLRWKARGARGSVDDGVDTFVVEAGKITAQTIHYTVLHQ